MTRNACRSPRRRQKAASAGVSLSKTVRVTSCSVAAASAQDSKSFLLSKPGGAYTTARTCRNGRSVFEWETHVERRRP